MFFEDEASEKEEKGKTKYFKARQEQNSHA